MPWLPLIAKGIGIRGYLLFELTYDPQRFGHAKPFHPAAYSSAKNYVLDGVASGALKPAIARVFPFDQIVKAHQYIEENQNLGKVVVQVSQV